MTSWEVTAKIWAPHPFTSGTHSHYTFPPQKSAGRWLWIVNARPPSPDSAHHRSICFLLGTRLSSDTQHTYIHLHGYAKICTHKHTHTWPMVPNISMHAFPVHLPHFIYMFRALTEGYTDPKYTLNLAFYIVSWIYAHTTLYTDLGTCTCIHTYIFRYISMHIPILTYTTAYACKWMCVHGAGAKDGLSLMSPPDLWAMEGFNVLLQPANHPACGYTWDTAAGL